MYFCLIYLHHNDVIIYRELQDTYEYFIFGKGDNLIAQSNEYTSEKRCKMRLFGRKEK